MADAKAGFWAAGYGRLSRLDAKGATTASWTFADDELFGAGGIVPAREGGVWLWGGPSIAWFDGRSFRDVVAAPTPAPGTSWVVDVAEAPDGSLWAAVNREPPPDGTSPANQGAVFRWDGASWIDMCRPRPPDDIVHVAVDPAGGVWVATGSGTSVVSFFDGTTWSIPPSDPAWTADRGGVNAWAASLVAADDGSLWFAYGGLGHFEGRAWASAGTDAVNLSGTVSLAAPPDGSVWLATGSVNLPGDTWGPHTGTAVAHFEGGSWTVYDSADGLPAPQPSNWATITAVAASSDVVIAATRDGFYRLSGDRWVRAGPRPAAGPVWAQRLLAVSAREAWAPATMACGTSATAPGPGSRSPTGSRRCGPSTWPVRPTAPSPWRRTRAPPSCGMGAGRSWKRGGARGHHRERRRDLGRRATIGRLADDRRLVPLGRPRVGAQRASGRRRHGLALADRRDFRRPALGPHPRLGPFAGSL